MEIEKGSLLNAVFMVSGLCIGGAMIGLPASMSGLGLFGAIIMISICWLFMSYTALLTYEVNSAYPVGCHFLTMASRSLGWWGKLITSICYLILLYALVAAYLNASGAMLQDLFSDLAWHPNWLSPAIVLAFVSGLITCGTRIVAKVNRIFMIGLVFAYLLMVAIVLPYASLPTAHFPQLDTVPTAVVVALTSFGFHILIPTIRGYLADDDSRIVKAMLYGGFIALLVYLLWTSAVLASVSTATLALIRAGNLSSSAMLQPMFSHIKHPLIAWSGHYFVLLAVLTSFIGVLVSLLDFLADSLSIGKHGLGMLKLLLVALLPPVLFYIFYPHGFVLALSYAGIMVAILHGILPALMAWKLRSREIFTAYVAPGGNGALALVFILAVTLVIFELF